MEQDLFGNLVDTSASRFLQHVPFSDSEADVVLDDAPGLLLQELGDCIKALRAEKVRAPGSNRLTNTKKRFFENVDWIYDLSETPAVLSFDVACDHCEIDSDVIRSRVSAEFGDEIREFFTAYSSVDAVDAIRVARKLKRFVDLGH